MDNLRRYIITISIVVILCDITTCKQSSFPAIDPWVYQDFDLSIQLARYSKKLVNTKRRVGINGTVLHDFFKDLYDKYNPSVLLAAPEPKIPKIIHWIWIGGEIPEIFKHYMQTWVDCHQHLGWQFKVWTDENIRTLDLYNRTYYNSVDNPGIKADLARLEILYQEGGVYIDTDFECLGRSLDLLNHLYDFYVGIQPLDSGFLQLANGLVATRPGHPIIKHAIETIKDDWHFTDIPTKTGPIHLTRSFFFNADRDGNIDIAFPARYFYPLSCKATTVERERWLAEGAFGIHWWSKMWLPPRFRPKGFKQIVTPGVQ